MYPVEDFINNLTCISPSIYDMFGSYAFKSEQIKQHQTWTNRAYFFLSGLWLLFCLLFTNKLALFSLAIKRVIPSTSDRIKNWGPIQ